MARSNQEFWPKVRRSGWDDRRDAEERRIETAALQLFLEHGIDEVTVEQIALAAGISRRTFFRYFPARDDVLVATPVRSMLRSMEEFCARPLMESVLDALLATTSNSMQNSGDSELDNLSRQVMARFPVPWRRVLAQVRRETDTAFAEAVAYRFRQTGRDATHASVLGATLAAIMVQTYLDWASEGCEGRFEDRLESALQAVSELLDGSDRANFG